MISNKKMADDIFYRSTLLKILLVIAAVLLINAHANDKRPIDKQFYVRAHVATGYGIDKTIDTPDGTELTATAGGGYAGMLNIGYVINPLFDVELSAGTHISSSSWLNYPEGDFTNNIALATIFYKTQTTQQYLKIGAGLGIYTDAVFKAQYDNTPNTRAKIEQQYKDAIGAHVMIHREVHIDTDWSWMLGISLYSVIYKQKQTVSVNGVEIQNNFTDTIDGSGIDGMVGIVRYF